MFDTKTEEYLYLRAKHRKQAEQDFFTYHNESRALVVAASEVVAGMTENFTQLEIKRVQQGQYIADLVVSFCRSYFIALDLILASELMEASTIIRKQIEVLARLYEIKNEKRKIVRKSPNVGVLYSDKLRKLYSTYSEGAHSASPDVMRLLGKNIFRGTHLTPVFPVFHVNTYITLQHLCLTVIEFFNWSSNFVRLNFPTCDASHSETYINRMLDAMENVYDEKTFGTPSKKT